jgi:hypothetical protein
LTEEAVKGVMKELMAAIIKATFLLTKFAGCSVIFLFFPFALCRVSHAYRATWMSSIYHS